MMNYKFLVFQLFLVCSSQTLFGQPENPQDPKNLDITFSIFPLVSEDWDGIFYFPNGDPEKPEELKFNLYKRSAPYEYKGPRPLKFYRQVKGPEDETFYSQVGVVTFSPDTISGDFILFFDSEEGLYQITKMLNSDASYPDESLVIFNTMPITFKAVLGKNTLEIPPGASEPINLKPYLGNSVPIAMAINHDNELHLVMKNKMRFSPGRKTLLVLRKPMNKKSLRIRSQRLTESSNDEKE